MAHLYQSANTEYEYMAQAAVNSTPFTMAAWFKCADELDRRMVMSIANSGSDVYYWAITVFNTVQQGWIIARDSGGVGSCLTTNTWSAGAWHHLCGIFAASDSRRIVLNGDWANSGTSVVSRTPSGVNKTAVGVNCRSTLQWPMNGSIAEAAIWNVALNQAEVSILAKGYSPLFVRPQNLVEYWNLINLPPVSRMSGNSLTAAGAVSKSSHCPILQPSGRLIQYKPAPGLNIAVLAEHYRKMRVA